MSYIVGQIYDIDQQPLFYSIIDACEAHSAEPFVYRVPANRKAEHESVQYSDYARNEQEAAEMLAENKHADWDHPDEFEFIVTDPAGKRWKCNVYVEYEPVFSAVSKEMN